MWLSGNNMYLNLLINLKTKFMKKNKLLQVAMVMLPLLLMSVWTFGQVVRVHGGVTDESGEPLPGVNVVVKGTTQGSITDINGKYQIDADSKSTLVFSFIGYNSRDEVVGGRKEINVKLTPSNLQVDEVVVVGYGTSKKSDISGSVASVSRDEMMKKAPTNILQGLQGAAAGVIVTAQDGAPDANAAIRIRGVATINGSAKPLYVVDGVPIFSGDTGGGNTAANALGDINPSDIETMTVLKDGAATAIYGSRAANGVVLITTKKGNDKEELANCLEELRCVALESSLSMLEQLDLDKFKESN